MQSVSGGLPSLVTETVMVKPAEAAPCPLHRPDAPNVVQPKSAAGVGLLSQSEHGI